MINHGESTYSYISWNRLEKLVLLGALPFTVSSVQDPRHEVVLDLRLNENQAGATPRQRVGSVQAPIGRAEMARRLLKMGWVGKDGRLGLIVGTEEERVRLLSEVEAVGVEVSGKVDVDVVERS